MISETRKREIRKTAEDFRDNCKIGKYGIIDPFKECDRAGIKLIRYPLGENADLGFALQKDQDMIIFTNSSIRLSREYFTLAHELGHVRLHMAASKVFLDTQQTLADSIDNDEKEQEANYFAANLLMPEHEIRSFLDLAIPEFPENKLTAYDVAKMMSEFNVSFDTALNRLESLKIINAEERSVIDNKKTETRVGNLLKSVGGNGRLNEVSQVVSIPYEYIDQIIYNYNHDAIPKETLEKALAYYNLKLEDISDKLLVKAPLEEDLDDLIGGLDI